MPDWFALYGQAVSILIYLAVATHLLICKNNNERFQILIAVIGFFSIEFLLHDFFVAQFFFLAWLAFVNIPLLIPRNLALGLLLASLLIGLYSPAFILVSLTLYIIVLWHFLFSAFQKLRGRVHL